MADAGLTDHGLKTLWEHFDQLVDAITDPDTLAEKACEVDLIHPECKRTLQSFPVDAKTKARSLIQSIEGKIKDQPVCFNLFLAVLKKLPGLANLGATLQKTYDDKLAPGTVGDGANGDCVDNSTIHLVAEPNSCVCQDEHNHSTSPQQEDNGMSGGSRDSAGLPEPSYLNVDDAILGEEDAFDVKRAIKKVAARFYSVGSALGLLASTLDKIQNDNPHDSEQALVQVINTWLARQFNAARFGAPSWRKLVCAVASPAGGNNHLLANEIAEDHPVVRRKHPLDKSPEEPEAVEKRPCLEISASEISNINSHSLNVATDSPLMKHRPKLAAFYSHQPEVPEGTWPPVKKTQYINLALIRTEQAIDFNKEFLRQTIRGSIDDIMKDKDDINYDEVFTEVEEGTRLLFEGRPGCGKTTMMNKVSQDWAKAKIFSSCLLFLVHLRRLGNRSDIDLETVLRSTPVEFSDEEFRELAEQIESSQGKGIVFALDGLDEYSPEKKYKKTTFIHKLIKGEVLPKCIVIVASRPAASLRYRRNSTKCIEVLGFLKDQIYEYINSYFDGKDSLVVGLRTYLEHHPNVMHMCYLPLHMAMVTYLYEVEEASLPQTETEIYRHFTLSTLLRSIHKRDEMEIDDEEEFCFQSFDDLQPEDRGVFDCILKLAYEATVVNPQQVFSAEEVRKFTSRRSNDTANSDNSLGLVVVDKYFVRYGLKEIYTFLHLTFQEFLSACHIVQLDSRAQEEIILKYGSDKRLGVVWKFYCGMTQFSGENMLNFEQLVEKTKSEVLLHVRCAHESQQDILCTHTINSCDSKIVLNSLSLNPADFTALGYVLTTSNVPATELAITSCNIGPEGLSALEKAVNVSSPPLKTLSFHKTKVKKIIPELCSVLTKLPQLRNLIFSSCGIIMKSLSEMAATLPALESVEQLDLSYNDFAKTSVEVLPSFLGKLPKLKKLVWIDGLLTLSLFHTLIKRDVEINLVNKRSDSPIQRLRLGGIDVNSVSRYFQAHPCSAVFVQELDLCDKGMDDTDAQSLAKCLPHCINLQQLHLRHNNISDAGAQALVEGLQRCSNLQTLNLRHNNISDAGAQSLAEGLQHCFNLQMLDLMDNKIGNTGAQGLAECLQHCTNLKELFLYGNDFDGAGAQPLAECLPHCTNPQNLNLRQKNIDDAGAQTLAISLQYYTDIRTLDLYENEIKDAGAQALAEGLRHCTHLQKLNVGYNGIGEAGAQAVAKGLQHCTNLQELDLCENNIGTAGAQALAEGLQHCTNLQKLHLWGNNIEDPGGQALVEGLQHCTSLQELSLSLTALTDSSVGSLSQLIRAAKQLNELRLYNNHFTRDGERALKAAAEERNSNPDFAKLDVKY